MNIDWNKVKEGLSLQDVIKEENKENNNVDNLEWCDSSYNIKDMYRRRGKYDNDDNIIKKYKELKSCNKVAKLFNMTGENVRGVLIRNNVERK